MLIGKNWRIESNKDNIILSKRYVGKKGERWHIVGYYGTVQNALKDLMNHGVRGTELKEIITVVKMIDELYTLIDRVGVSIRPVTKRTTMGKKVLPVSKR